MAAPAAYSAGSSSATTITPTPQPAPTPGQAFGPLSPAVPQTTTPTQTHINTRRPGSTPLGHGTLLLLVGVAFAMIIGVGGLIWYEGRNRRATAKRRRQRLRSGRTPQPQAAAAGRRGPPPPPRKRRAQSAAKRKKR